MKAWLTRSYNMSRGPVEKATWTAVVTLHILYFRKEGTQDGNRPSTKPSELCFLPTHPCPPPPPPLSPGNFWSIHVPRALPQDRLTECVCIKVNFNYPCLGSSKDHPSEGSEEGPGKGTCCNEISVSNKVEAHGGEWPKEALKEKKQGTEVRLERLQCLPACPPSSNTQSLLGLSKPSSW